MIIYLITNKNLWYNIRMVNEPEAPQKPPKTAHKRLLDNEDYHSLKDVPPESEYLQERKNRSPRTARAYEVDIEDFKKFVNRQYIQQSCLS